MLNNGGERLLLAAVFSYVIVICLFPLARLFFEALFPAQGDVVSLLAGLFESKTVAKAVKNTLEAGIGSAMLSLFMGTAMALVIGLTDIRCKTLLVFLLLLPMLIPAQITAVSWLELTGPSSSVLAVFGYELPPGSRNPLYSREGVIFLLGIEHAAMVFLAVRTGLRSIPKDLIEAARCGGASPLKIIAFVILPLLAPFLIAGAALAFTAAIGNFGIPALLGIPGRYLVLSTLIYQRLSSFGPSVLSEVGGLSLILALMAVAGLFFQYLASKKVKVELVQGGQLEPPFTLGKYRWPVELLVWFILLFVSVLPLLALIETALLPALGVDLSFSTLTFSNFSFVFEHGASSRAFLNSSLLGLAAATLVVMISLPFAYLVVIRKNKLASTLNMVADAPFALPGIVLSIAFIMTFIRPLPMVKLSLYNTIWIILLAYMARFLAFGLRPVLAGMSQIDRSLEEAGQIGGASSWQRMTRIIIPLSAPSAMAAAILVFMGAFNELTVSSLLWSSGNETLGVVIFNLYDEGNSTGAAAVASLTVFVTLVIAGILTLLSRKTAKGVLPWQE